MEQLYCWVRVEWGRYMTDLKDWTRMFLLQTGRQTTKRGRMTGSETANGYMDGHTLWASELHWLPTLYGTWHVTGGLTIVHKEKTICIVNLIIKKDFVFVGMNFHIKFHLYLFKIYVVTLMDKIKVHILW